MALEEASKVRAAILMKKALYAKKKDGRKTVRAARAARRDMKEAAVDQKRANAVFMREERKIRGADKKAERAISKSMRVKVGLSKAKEASRQASKAAKSAEAKAKRATREAREVSVKLEAVIDRSSRSVKAMDRDMLSSMKVVLPSEKADADKAVRRAKQMRTKLKHYTRMVAKGRKYVSAFSRKARHAQDKRQFSVIAAISRVNGKLNNAMTKITSASKRVEKRMKPKED